MAMEILMLLLKRQANNSTADDKIVWYANNGSESFTEYDVDTDLNRPYRFKLWILMGMEI